MEFFYNKVQEDIVESTRGTMYEIGNELSLPSGRADLYLHDNNLCYLWELKPASRGWDYEKELEAFDQLDKYIAIDRTFYQPGGLQIQDGQFTYSTSICHVGYTENVTYYIEYQNAQNGLFLSLPQGVHCFIPSYQNV